MQYVYSEKNGASHKSELLELCAFLPKLQTVVTGSTGTISYLDLLSETSDPNIMKQQCITADHFINLLSLNKIALPRKFSKDGTFFTDAEILEKYKNDIYPSKSTDDRDEK